MFDRGRCRSPCMSSNFSKIAKMRTKIFRLNWLQNGIKLCLLVEDSWFEVFPSFWSQFKAVLPSRAMLNVFLAMNPPLNRRILRIVFEWRGVTKIKNTFSASNAPKSNTFFGVEGAVFVKSYASTHSNRLYRFLNPNDRKITIKPIDSAPYPQIAEFWLIWTKILSIVLILIWKTRKNDKSE